jgi:hypothetical protein
MNRYAAILRVAAAVLAAAAVPAAAQDRKDELRQLVFEVCPKVLDGTVSLTDTAQLASLGFKATDPRETESGKLPRAEKGTDTGKIVLSSGPGTCSVWFGGPGNSDLAGSLVEEARKAGFEGGRPFRLGDSTPLFSFKGKVEPKRSLIIFLADAGGELNFKPATTVVMMNDKGN